MSKIGRFVRVVKGSHANDVGQVVGTGPKGTLLVDVGYDSYSVPASWVRLENKNPIDGNPALLVHRKGYQRSGYTRKATTAGHFTHTASGEKVWVPRHPAKKRIAPTRVHGATFKVKDRGLPGRGPYTLPPLHEGGLGGPGYTEKSQAERHHILESSTKQEGYRKTLGKVMLLERYGKRTMSAEALRVLKADREWLVAKYGGKGTFGPRATRKRNPIDVSARYALPGDPNYPYRKKAPAKKARKHNPTRPAVLTRDEFEKRYWGKDAHTVPASTRREFYSDYRESHQSFAAYKKATSMPVDSYFAGRRT